MMVVIKALDAAARAKRFAIRHGKADHIDDEVIVTLMLDAWAAGEDRLADTYSSEVLRRVTKHVRAHVRKNPGWQRLGGGSHTATDDFCADTVLSILEDKVKGKGAACHAEQAFGNYVYRRCQDEAGKLYAKKHSAGQSLDEDESVEAEAQASDTVDLLATPKSPEQILIEFEDYLAEEAMLEKIRAIVQGDELPELPKLAFTFRYFGHMKNESIKQGAITVTSLIGVTEKTATKYINQAIEIIKQRLTK